jgi:hypothetical protein
MATLLTDMQTVPKLAMVHALPRQLATAATSLSERYGKISAVPVTIAQSEPPHEVQISWSSVRAAVDSSAA